MNVSMEDLRWIPISCSFQLSAKVVFETNKTDTKLWKDIAL